MASSQEGARSAQEELCSAGGSGAHSGLVPGGAAVSPTNNDDDAVDQDAFVPTQRAPAVLREGVPTFAPQASQPLHQSTQSCVRRCRAV